MARPEIDEQICRLWDELADFGPAGCDRALGRALRGLSEIMDAQRAFWFTGVRLQNKPARDPFGGWRAKAPYHLNGLSVQREIDRAFARRMDSGQIDPTTVANLKGAGQFRVNISHQLVSADWFESDFYHTFFEPFGVQDAIYVAMPLTPDVESWMGFYRVNHPAPFFGEPERALLEKASRPMKWFHRQVTLNSGLLVAEEPLTPSERRVLNGLLTEKTEAEIAAEVNLAPRTVHTYATRIYRKFGVRGRFGLTALWLGQPN